MHPLYRWKPGFEHESGMVLFMTLMLLAIFSLLILSLLQTVFMYTKTNQQHIQEHQKQYQLEAIAHQLIAKMPQTIPKQCMIQEVNPNALLPLLNTQKTCTWIDSTQNYRYLLSHAGQYPCLQINLSGMLIGSEHWILTVADSQNRQLQLRFALPAKNIHCREKSKTIIPNRILSWRYLQS